MTHFFVLFERGAVTGEIIAISGISLKNNEYPF